MRKVDPPEPATRREIAAAVREDHSGPCPNTCDIGAALRLGEPFVAGFLLSGATETPALDRAGPWPTEEGSYHLPEGWEVWSAWATEHGVYCDACGAYAYPADVEHPTPPRMCGNCLQDLPDKERS